MVHIQNKKKNLFNKWRVDHPFPKKKKCKMAKWLSEEALQIAEEKKRS